MNDADIVKLYNDLSDEIVKLKRKYEDLEVNFEQFVKADIVNVSFKYSNKDSDIYNYADFTTTVTKGTKIPRPALHEGAVWVTKNGEAWQFGSWLAKTDITLIEKR